MAEDDLRGFPASHAVESMLTWYRFWRVALYGTRPPSQGHTADTYRLAQSLLAH
jgi:hypothetical protein